MINIDNMQGTGKGFGVHKVVIKLGSAVLAGEKKPIDEAVLRQLAKACADFQSAGVGVIIVTSGAVGVGRATMERKPQNIPDRQALAAIGQVGLMHTYKQCFNRRGMRVAQLLLTREDMEDRRRYLNARYTIERLLEMGAVPVINENDTVTIDELKFGDNDELSAVVASKIKADLLIILSVVDGVLESDQQTTIPVITNLAEVQQHIGSHTSGLGTGGMHTKLTAMDMASSAGTHVVLANGKRKGIIGKILKGRFPGSYLPARGNGKLSSRSRWLAFGRRPHGSLKIDAGACRALVEGKKSLLAAGVTAIHGTFACGDVVEILGPKGEALGRGLINFSSEQMQQIQGMKTPQIRKLLGETDYEEVVHRDNLVLQV